MPLFEIKNDKFDKRLLNNFIVPPFSTLDTRQGYWQDRKRMWDKLIGDASETRNGEFGKTFHFDKPSYKKRFTSNFDPVLVELMYRWFCIECGSIIDPFGGEQTKGVIAGYLGHEYLGIELRQEQVDYNNECVKKFENVKYKCGDSAAYINGPKNFDMCLTSPPYFDLETYSNKSEDLSFQSYNKFLDLLTGIFLRIYLQLKDDSFCVVKMGEVRREDGAYLGLVPDFIKLMTNACHFKYYNEIILINQSGSGSLRAAGNMKSRKVVKCHQNVLVFYKGDISQIKNKFEVLR